MNVYTAQRRTLSVGVLFQVRIWFLDLSRNVFDHLNFRPPNFREEKEVKDTFTVPCVWSGHVYYIVFTDGQARSADLRATTRYLAGLLSHPFQGVAPSRGYRRPGLSGLERYSVEGSPL